MEKISEQFRSPIRIVKSIPLTQICMTTYCVGLEHELQYNVEWLNLLYETNPPILIKRCGHLFSTCV